MFDLQKKPRRTVQNTTNVAMALNEIAQFFTIYQCRLRLIFFIICQIYKCHKKSVGMFVYVYFS